MTLDEKTEQLRAKLDELELTGVFIVSGADDSEIALCTHNINLRSAPGFANACLSGAKQLMSTLFAHRPKTTQDPSNNQEST